MNSVQSFFAVILAVALLAYVVVVIMATLANSSVLPYAQATVVNESGYINASGDYLNKYTTYGFTSPVIIAATNATNGANIAVANFTLSTGGLVTNLTTEGGKFNTVNFTYSYQYYSTGQINANSILGNVSNGTTSFFSSINPVYAILAILVIILVLVVLVRVVSGSVGNGSQQL